MKKSIAILGVFLLLTTCTCRNNAENFLLPKTEVPSAISVTMNPLFSLTGGARATEGGEDPPRKDLWQWLQLIKEVWELLGYRS